MEEETKKKAPSLKLIVGIAAVVIALILAVQNMQPVELRIFFWKQSVSPAVLLPITLVLGFFAGRFLRKP